MSVQFVPIGDAASQSPHEKFNRVVEIPENLLIVSSIVSCKAATHPALVRIRTCCNSVLGGLAVYGAYEDDQPTQWRKIQDVTPTDDNIVEVKQHFLSNQKLAVFLPKKNLKASKFDLSCFVNTNGRGEYKLCLCLRTHTVETELWEKMSKEPFSHEEVIQCAPTVQFGDSLHVTFSDDHSKVISEREFEISKHFVTKTWDTITLKTGMSQKRQVVLNVTAPGYSFSSPINRSILSPEYDDDIALHEVTDDSAGKTWTVGEEIDSQERRYFDFVAEGPSERELKESRKDITISDELKKAICSVHKESFGLQHIPIPTAKFDRFKSEKDEDSFKHNVQHPEWEQGIGAPEPPSLNIYNLKVEHRSPHLAVSWSPIEMKDVTYHVQVCNQDEMLAKPIKTSKAEWLFDPPDHFQKYRFKVCASHESSGTIGDKETSGEIMFYVPDKTSLSIKKLKVTNHERGLTVTWNDVNVKGLENVTYHIQVFCADEKPLRKTSSRAEFLFLPLDQFKKYRFKVHAQHKPSGKVGEETVSEEKMLCVDFGNSVHIDITKPIKGDYSVYEGYFGVKPRREVAIKIGQFENEKEKVTLKREVQNLIDLSKHENTVSYITSGKIGFTQAYIAMELCRAETLHDVVQRRDRSLDRKTILLHLISGLRHIHNLEILHRDLKPRNILFSLDGRFAKIADFGLSKKMQCKPSKSSFRASQSRTFGEDGWCAPEFYHNSAMVNRKSDIYSAGLVFHFVLSDGVHPFGTDAFDRKRNITGKDSSVRISVSADLCQDTDSAEDLILLMLEREPADRPIIEDVLKHPFFWNDQKRLDFVRDAINLTKDTVPSPKGVAKKDPVDFTKILCEPAKEQPELSTAVDEENHATIADIQQDEDDLSYVPVINAPSQPKVALIDGEPISTNSQKKSTRPDAEGMLKEWDTVDQEDHYNAADRNRMSKEEPNVDYSNVDRPDKAKDAVAADDFYNQLSEMIAALRRSKEAAWLDKRELQPFKNTNDLYYYISLKFPRLFWKVYTHCMRQNKIDEVLELIQQYRTSASFRPLLDDSFLRFTQGLSPGGCFAKLPRCTIQFPKGAFEFENLGVFLVSEPTAPTDDTTNMIPISRKISCSFGVDLQKPVSLHVKPKCRLDSGEMTVFLIQESRCNEKISRLSRNYSITVSDVNIIENSAFYFAISKEELGPLKNLVCDLRGDLFANGSGTFKIVLSIDENDFKIPHFPTFRHLLKFNSFQAKFGSFFAIELWADDEVEAFSSDRAQVAINNGITPSIESSEQCDWVRFSDGFIYNASLNRVELGKKIKIKAIVGDDVQEFLYYPWNAYD